MIRHTFLVLYSELKVSLVRLGCLTLARQVDCEGPLTDQQRCCCNSFHSLSQIHLLWPEILWPIHLTKELSFKMEKNWCKNDTKCWTEWFTCWAAGACGCSWDFSPSNSLLKCSPAGSFSPDLSTSSLVDMTERSLAASDYKTSLVMIHRLIIFVSMGSRHYSLVKKQKSSTQKYAYFLKKECWLLIIYFKGKYLSVSWK